MAIKFQSDSDVLFSGIMTNLCDSIKIDRTYSPLKWKKRFCTMAWKALSRSLTEKRGGNKREGAWGFSLFLLNLHS